MMTTPKPYEVIMQ